MSNNLRQIAKDLRSFVKRCKDVHYSDSLLITFLVTGLLTFVPRTLVADVVTEQQEVTAQTYDAITDLRQSFIRARKENEQSLKGAERELAMLLQQGEQVIKSPWASFQFGTGYTNNDWGTTYRGRGGKFLEYYRRNNDLTKYVFDPSKHLYGATNLNIPRNQEPNSLTINPANIHEPYKPYVPERLDNVNMIDGPSFNPNMTEPSKIITYKAPRNTFSITRAASSANANNILTVHNINPNSNFNDDIDDTISTDGTHFPASGTATTSTSNTSPDGTFTTSSGRYHREYWWDAAGATYGSTPITDISGNFSNGIVDSYGWGWSGYSASYYASYNDVDLNGSNTNIYGIDNRYGGYYYGTSYYAAWRASANNLITYFTSRYGGTYTDSTIPTGYTKTIAELAQDQVSWNGSNGYSYTTWTWNLGPGTTTYGTSSVTNNWWGSNYRAASILADSNVTIHDANFSVGNAGGLSDSSRNAIIVTGTSTTATVRDSDFTVTNDNNNAIRVDGGKLVIGSSNVAASLNSNYAGSSGTKATSTEISLQGNSNNGIIVKAGKAELTRVVMDTGNGRFNNGVVNNGAATDTVTDTNSAITIGGTDSNGFYQKGAGSTTLNGTQIIVNGSNNNGVRVSNGKLTTSLSATAAGSTTRGNITVGGTNNNGIFLDNGTNDVTANIVHTNIAANDTGIGLMVGNHLPTNSIVASTKKVDLTVSHSNIYADNTNGRSDGNGTGVYIYNTHSSGSAKFNEATYIHGNGNDILMNINNYNFDSTASGNPVTNKVEFHGATYTSRLVTSGDSNIGINIANGHRLRPAVTSIKGELNTEFIGNHNIGILNNYYADDLTIDLGLGSTAATPPVPILKPSSMADNGVMTADGNHNIMFANLGYIKSGTFNIDAIDMHGTGSIGLYFKGKTGTGLLSTDRVNIGMMTPVVNVQGVMGATDAHSSANSNDTPNSVGIYAVSGQRKEITQAMIGHRSGGTATVGDLKVDSVNIGLNENADNSVVLWAGEGTVIKAKNTRYAANVTQNGAITDGVMVATGGTKWGYDVHDEVVSSGSVIGYATGYLNPGTMGLLNYGSIGNLASQIDFDANVDMVAKKGTAYLANGGAIITAKATRAGGINSVIAYATGEHGINGGGSSITVNGNIVAADHNLLGSINNTGGVPNSYTISSDLKNTYNNVAGVAINGGQVTFKGTAIETQNTESALSNAAPSKSLIYGMAAYSIGRNTGNTIASKVKFETPVTVISGENGALYATNNGEIEFQGDIVNQNNIGPTRTTVAGVTGVTAGTRNGRGNVAGVTNDHADTTPFFVKRTREGNTSIDKAGILFNGQTNIDMYDGILLTGNQYNVNNLSNGQTGTIVRDYIADTSDATNSTAYYMAKYRGMSNVDSKILTDKGVNLGVINQSKDLIWNTEGNTNATGTPTGTANYLDSIGKHYLGGMSIQNAQFAATPGPNATADNTKVGNRFDSSLINSDLTIKTGTTVNIEDVETTKTVAATSRINDPFNTIKMESTLVTIENGATVKGDAENRVLKDIFGAKNFQVANAGLSMANSLSRWDDPEINSGHATSLWRKTKNDESGFINKGKIEITGGHENNNVAALNVAFGTVKNLGTDGTAEIKVDHGYGIYATDGSIVVADADGNTSKITVTGEYVKPTVAPTGGTNNGRGTETLPTGKNYGIVGISNGRVNYNKDDAGNIINSINIKAKDTTITVDGDLAVGIYAQNNDNANQTDVEIKYDDQNLNAAGIILQNKATSTPTNSRGVGIALVNNNPNYNGGIIELNGRSGTSLGTFTTAANHIFTQENGIGVYGENVKVNVVSKDFTVVTKDNGVGMWVTDNSEIAKGANHQKTFNYNYDGASNKNGFAMAFSGKRTTNTTASNDLDIKFSNKADSAGVDLAYEIAESKAATPSTTRGTHKGIAGILVNTNDAGDTVINRGNIEEDTSSKTHIRAYGAVVNKGIFENWGNIKLNDSLNAQANTITSEDMKKVNVGIFANSANDTAGGTYTTITNHGDITIGDSTNDKNIGSWAIYGYNVNTGAKADGSKSQITVNKNNYGIYSGDGNVNIQQTKILVGNDTVMGHVQTTSGVSTAPGAYPINRQTQYANPNNLLSALDVPRERDSVIGVYIDNNQTRTNTARNINVSADMDIDRFSYGIVMAEKNGGAPTNVTIGSATDQPTIRLAYSTNNNAGGHVKSTKPTNPKVPEEVYEQGNAVYYYSLDTASTGKSYANVTMDGDYNTAYYTKGAIDNYGTIDLRSKYDVDNQNNDRLGFGNVGVFSSNTGVASTNYGTITTGMSDTINMRYSAAMAAGRNVYKTDGKFDRTQEEGYIVNRGIINVKEKEGIGMFATGTGSKALNYGTINLEGESSIGMYLDRGAIGENHGTITGNANNLSGVVAINGGYIKNYGTINVTGTGSYGIVTDGSRFIVDANGNPTEVLSTSDSRYLTSAAKTAGQTNGQGGTDLYGGTESSIEEGTTGNPKTTGVGTTITAPDIVPITKISVDGVDTPIFNVESDAATPGSWAQNITVTSSIQTGGTRIIDLNTKDEWGNPAWPHHNREQMSEVTSIGMYVDTSGVRYTNPINGIENLPKLSKVNLYFGPEATLYTNSKAIRIGDKVDENGNLIAKSNILKPFNDALNKLPGGAKVNPLSASLTWQVLAKISDDNQLTEVYMSKVPYHSFAFDDDKSLVNFTNNLDNIYEIARPGSPEKVIFNKLNTLGNGEGHILAQAFDQMRGHIYGGVQQRIKATSDILGGEINGLRGESNGSKDSNKFKAFGQRNEFKTDTAGMPDWFSNAGGFVYVHEDETVRLGQSSGWYAGVVNNYFTFKDLSKSYENQAMAKVGAFKQIPLDENGTLRLNIGGDGFIGRNDTKRRFWVIDQEFRAKANYYSYGAGANIGLEKAFVINDGFSIVPSVGIKAEYGRFSGIHEVGDMALNVKSDDYISVKPNVGIDFKYTQPVFKNTNFTAALGFSYENEIGKVNSVENEARIVGAWTDYYTIKGDKEDKKGNFKSHLNLGLDNGRLGFTVNTGYETKGHNFKAGLGLKVLY